MEIARHESHVFTTFFSSFLFFFCLARLLLQCTWQTSLKECQKVRNYARRNRNFFQRVQETGLTFAYSAKQNVDRTACTGEGFGADFHGVSEFTTFHQ